jgi:hypothetical protein
MELDIQNISNSIQVLRIAKDILLVREFMLLPTCSRAGSMKGMPLLKARMNESFGSPFWKHLQFLGSHSGKSGTSSPYSKTVFFHDITQNNLHFFNLTNNIKENRPHD